MSIEAQHANDATTPNDGLTPEERRRVERLFATNPYKRPSPRNSLAAMVTLFQNVLSKSIAADPDFWGDVENGIHEFSFAADTNNGQNLGAKRRHRDSGYHDAMLYHLFEARRRADLAS